MKKTITTIVSLGIVFSLIASIGIAAEAARMSQDELKSKLDNPEVVIVDVRSYTDWIMSREKIQGAERENYRDFEGWATKYPKDKTVVLYCA